MLGNVLIVDDSAVMRKIVAKSIIQAGYVFARVLEASDGYEALHQISQNRFDLVLTDVNMPNMDGLELARIIQEMNLDPPLPVVIITTEGTEDKIHEAEGYGVRAYLTKPFAPAQLKAKLGPILDERQEA
ncbi:MAG: response regulator [Acidobacteria bacterium]|nr:response regulator [Acidobacteriota bacterium]